MEVSINVSMAENGDFWQEGMDSNLSEFRRFASLFVLYNVTSCLLYMSILLTAMDNYNKISNNNYPFLGFLWVLDILVN